MHRREAVAGHSRLDITVEDDGKGFHTEAPANGLGLIGLRERIEALGGEFEIEAAADAETNRRGNMPAGRDDNQTGFTRRGTCVVATIPVATDNRSKGA